ncbi:MAG: alpha/beta hydrolase family esterase, partial [Nocardioidaceae bacterium]
MPEPSRAARPAPLIVGFHGRGETPASFSAASGLSAAPAVVAYPRGVTTEDGVTDWQGSPWAARGVDDVGFTRGLVHRLEHDLCIDRDRVYAVGHSDGGNLAAQVACALPHRIAAVATYGGAFYGQDAICGRRPTAVLEMHSVDDPVVPYDGLRLPMTTLAPVPDLVRAQADV